MLPHVKIVNPARGGTYYYFDTGRKKLNGSKIYKRLPDPSDRSFGATYGAYCAALTRREGAGPELTLVAMIKLYRQAPAFRDLKPSSQRIYDVYLKQLGEAFNTAWAAGLLRTDMAALIESMADRPAAANLMLKVTSALFVWAIRRGHAQTNPCDNIGTLAVGEHQPWPDDLLAAGLAADDDLVRMAVHMLYYTGQRIGDVCGMRWTDYRDGRIEIVQEKTGKKVSVPPHPELRKLLDVVPKRALTILAVDGRPIARQELRHILQSFAADLGHKVVPHGLRKNAVNGLLEAGCSIAETAAITRQSLQMVEHYAKQRDNRKLADAAILKWSGAK